MAAILRLLSLFFFVALVLGACKKDDVGLTDGGMTSTPRTPVPQELVGMWFSGTIGLVNFYNPSNGQWTNDSGIGQFTKLNADGTFEFGWQRNNTYYGCSTADMRFLKGTVVVNGSTLTLHDTYRRARREYSRALSSNSDRPEELKVHTISVELSEDAQGNQLLMIRTEGTEFVQYKRLE